MNFNLNIPAVSHSAFWVFHTPSPGAHCRPKLTIFSWLLATTSHILCLISSLFDSQIWLVKKKKATVKWTEDSNPIQETQCKLPVHINVLVVITVKEDDVLALRTVITYEWSTSWHMDYFPVTTQIVLLTHTARSALIYGSRRSAVSISEQSKPLRWRVSWTKKATFLLHGNRQQYWVWWTKSCAEHLIPAPITSDQHIKTLNPEMLQDFEC